jgi:hypothetical protein
MRQTILCDAIATEDTSGTRWICAVEPVVRVLNVVFWVVTPLLVAALFLLNAPVVIAVLMVAVVVCSGAIA